MKKAARRGDLCTGHDDCSPRPAQRGSPHVTFNARAALRVTDPFVNHGCAAHAPHPGKVAEGSTTVTIDGLPAARVTDPVDCGSTIQTGSADVYIGD
jgi:uncharacterized Zn-binding protein involved in type VI secretion